ncbi:biotin--[acetyl-CoA-carboxylase] ligase [Erythrobacter sp. GH3-10]|uniref:biotin--[biotin carboxyl-carrier protein] ligase n=2 Tax=Aurantiacibacter rhizosphaerae TaxID=2691582 RepID=A0A844XEA6_9SPHN|nr:biotin--[acetyl-CoA-carboxylase] ligase [Aurantiacibacter rhizosphaerae]
MVARLAQGERMPDGHWLVANRQTGGRGRQGRSWIDAPGNFMGSTAVQLHDRDPAPATLSFVAALAVYETVLPMLANPSALMLKWPNDVLFEGAKFCGLLLEREAGHAVIGIGVNLKAAPAIEDRKVKALSDTGPAPERDAFAQALANQMALEFQRWREFGAEPIINRWKAAAHKPGTALCVHNSDGSRISGTFDGLDQHGALRLRLPDGTTHMVHAGDVLLEER